MSTDSLLSKKPIDPRDRLIFALDVPTLAEARAWVDRLGDVVTFYKIGLEFCMSGEYFTLLAELKARGKKVFADLKFSDVPATVKGAMANLVRHGADFCTLHGTSGVYRAVVPVKGSLRLLAVTVLTSVDENEVREMGWSGAVEDLVLQRARVAIESGIDGLIASGQEATRLRRELGDQPILITPGIRAESEKGSDDQKRTMTVEQAFRAGADYIVVGRPIRNAPDPKAAAEGMQQEIARVFGA
ncbi:orotidine 5'-phosphate decarboxylase [Chthoniobacter flavus Ellin428]|uniref:Orotidine 5'-phosphate decarboxylase n=1 Tax=Chthoniobacter flavus Ellin428 TaxID=497964 RepID=B4CWP1_9BACT|nr:orotidine-5'-phosphate decarboxylase [Chthoniobacter flavus]EDY21833.1 orotidine 5'-phosphate decarboxylase [Chthoniobacter flavus Ellin428]TCO95760.1 orotidine-5'-phosphate decarboxylase [Chthoniobacter flavus]